MLNEFESCLKDKFPYLLEEKSIVCCSGGIDSVVLFYLMLSVSKNFVVAHCNFKLRGGESDRDQDFVKDPNTKISQLLNEKNATILSFTRFEVGEGIEVEKVDFATEVMSQIEG